MYMQLATSMRQKLFEAGANNWDNHDETET